MPSIETLFPWLDPHWQEVAQTTQFRGPTDTPYPPSAATSMRPDLDPATGVAETVVDLRARALDPSGVEAAILVCAYATEAVKNPDAAAALSTRRQLLGGRAVARRTSRACTGRSSCRGFTRRWRSRRSNAAPKIPGFVQVVLPVRSFAPYGNRIWWPLLEVVTRHGLVLDLHFGGASGDPPTSVGWPSTYLEEYVDMPSAFQTQIMSLVAEGAFDRFPDLRVLCAESGFAWLPSFMWRFDRLWHGLRREMPWVRRAPSAYIREHIRVTTQPFDAPVDGGSPACIDHIGSDEMLCYATDYPHWQSETAEAGIPPLPEGPALEAILGGNARRLFGLGGERNGG